MPNVETLRIKQPIYLYECRECGHEFLLNADAEPQCPKCKGFSVEPSERSE